MKKMFTAMVFFTMFCPSIFADTAFSESDARTRLFIIIIILLIFLIGLMMIALHVLLELRRKKEITAKPMDDLDYALLYMEEADSELYDDLHSIPAPAIPAPAIPADTDGDVYTIPQGKRSKFMELERVIRKLLLDIPAGLFFDVHVIVEKLLQEHDGVYLTNVGQYTSAAQYHAKISTIISQNTALVEMAGKSYSKNIHEKFSECHLFKRKSTVKEA